MGERIANNLSALIGENALIDLGLGAYNASEDRIILS